MIVSTKKTMMPINIAFLDFILLIYIFFARKIANADYNVATSLFDESLGFERKLGNKS